MYTRSCVHTYLRIHKRHGDCDEVDVSDTMSPLLCRVEIRAQILDRDDCRKHAIRWLQRGHPHVILAHRSRVVLTKARKQELTLQR